MERSEPSLVPEWLKSSGSVTGGGSTTHQFALSSLHSDNNSIPKHTRNKSSGKSSDHELGRTSVSDRTTSSYFRRSSSGNGSAQLRSYSSYGRSHRNRDWEDIYESRDKERLILGDHRHQDYPDPSENILSSRFEKEGLRRSHSMISGKRDETCLRKVGGDLSNSNKNNQNNSNGLSGGSPICSVHKASFERDFPSLGAEERQAVPEIGRVPSPVLSMAIQNLPLGASAAIGGDKWTSALAEAPVVIGSNGAGASSVQQAVPAISAFGASSMTTGLNMAETLAQGPPRAQTTPQLADGALRLEELAIKQSRQLIPVTPSMPKPLVLNSSEKPKLKIGLQQHHVSSSQLVNHFPLGGPVKSDFSKSSSLGKLHVLKLAREKNVVAPTAKDSLSPTSSSKAANCTLAVAPSVVGSAPLRSSGNNPILSNAGHKPVKMTLEKRPTPQALSRNDFFNLVRKKSMTNSSSVPVSSSVLDKPRETESITASAVSLGKDASLVDSSGEDRSTENRGDLSCNGDAGNDPQKLVNNGKNHSTSYAILYPEEQEVAFLRSLGWEENDGEDEGLTEEEISEFYRNLSKYISSRPYSKIFKGMQSRFLVLLNSQMGSIGGISYGVGSSDSKLES